MFIFKRTNLMIPLLTNTLKTESQTTHIPWLQMNILFRWFPLTIQCFSNFVSFNLICDLFNKTWNVWKIWNYQYFNQLRVALNDYWEYGTNTNTNFVKLRHLIFFHVILKYFMMNKPLSKLYTEASTWKCEVD